MENIFLITVTILTQSNLLSNKYSLYIIMKFYVFKINNLKFFPGKPVGKRTVLSCLVNMTMIVLLLPICREKSCRRLKNRVL